jgi:hypothetical protein
MAMAREWVSWLKFIMVFHSPLREIFEESFEGEVEHADFLRETNLRSPIK